MTDKLEPQRAFLGRAVGGILAPLVGLIAHARQARTFHPDGIVVRAQCTPVNDSPLARRLAGPVLARCSGALRREGHDAFDVLGIALRFRDGDLAHDQDLLFATIVSPFTMPTSPFTTRSSDFLLNRFHAVAPFDVDGLPARMKFRLAPLSLQRHAGDSRAERLRSAMAQGQANWHLEARPVFHWKWEPIAVVAFEERIAVDQKALRFDPFQNGRGIRPRGVVHAMRHATYAASQAQR